MALALPPTYLLQTHLSLEVLHELEDQIASLTYDITEAKLVLGKVTTKQRALFELRSRNLLTEEVSAKKAEAGAGDGKVGGTRPPKRRKVENLKDKEVILVDSSTESDTKSDTGVDNVVTQLSQVSTKSRDLGSSPIPNLSSPLAPDSPSSNTSSVELSAGIQSTDIEWGDTIKIVKLAWFTESIAAGYLLPLEEYLVYEGRPVQGPEPVLAEPHIKKKV